MTEKYMQVTIHGDCCTWREVAIRKSREDGCAKGKNSKKGDLEITESERLAKRARRQKVALIRLLSALSEKPYWFITLGFDRSEWPEISVVEAKRIFDNFARGVRRKFPACWFVYKMEWSPTARYHFHLMGRCRAKIGKRELYQSLFMLWGRLVRWGSESVHIVKCDFSRHFGYITKREKWNNEIKLIGDAGKCRTFGVINRAKLPLLKKEGVVLTVDQWKFVRNRLIVYHKKNSKSMNYHKRVFNSSGILAYTPRKIIEESIALAVEQSYQDVR
ncbi:hypothetical protein [Desulfovibrio psychrotolerans]|uniref:Uncharacterized protein n=1 Tax=Desulfovibrio psychrotolerans TaxID=415242 RepID=A0A7J0BT55_9BACT|nr:hypothetical protein [Desulfovibrio psychrotolerans]GFM36903.1 hypothetical protein DSM19430T_15870 [Desulfovibrio psychrotolerans]